MALGKSVRIYLADGNVSGVRHGEIVNWTGQAIACPRTRFPDLKDWTETKRPGVYFLFGQNEESGQDAVYIGEAEVVIDRLSSHLNGKEFWTELIAFTSKDDNLTKGHVRYLESRLIQLANISQRYQLENTAVPQLPSLPRADRDAMEEFIGGVRTLLGVLGHKVIEPLISKGLDAKAIATEVLGGGGGELATNEAGEASEARPIQPTFQLRVGSLVATAIRTDEGLVVLADSEAALLVQSSLSMGYRSLRESLLSSGVLIESGSKLKFTRDQLFRSPSQAAAVVVGYSINGRDAWRNLDGITYSEFESRLTRATFG